MWPVGQDREKPEQSANLREGAMRVELYRLFAESLRALKGVVGKELER